MPAFQASQFLVSNAEFLPFVLAGGYKSKRWWIGEDGDDGVPRARTCVRKRARGYHRDARAEGWRWASYRNATHPSFWVATARMREYFGGTAVRPHARARSH